MNQDVATARAIEIFQEREDDGTGFMYFEEWAASVIHKNDKLVENNLRVGFECFDK